MLPTSPVTLLSPESCVTLSHSGRAGSGFPEVGFPGSETFARCSKLIYTDLLSGSIPNQYYA